MCWVLSKGSGLVIRDENKKIIKFNNDGFSHLNFALKMKYIVL